MKILVNLITICRLSFTIILANIKYKISNTTFVVSIISLFLTDSIDGMLARKYRVQTFFGSMMDTIADKVLSIVLCLMLINEENSLIPVLICEIIIAIINLGIFCKTKKTYSSIIGKLKMWFLGATIVLAYLTYFNIVPQIVTQTSAVFTMVMEVATIITYSAKLFSKKNRKNINYKIKNLEDVKYILFNTNYYLELQQS